MDNIRLDHVSFSYPNGYEAVHDVTLEIKAGERVAILGQNGAGKTTTVKLMNNLNKPTTGDVLVGERNTKDFTTAQISQVVGYVFQNPDDQIFHATVREEVEYGPRVALGLSEGETDARTERALKLVGLWEKRETNPFDLPLSVRKFVAIAAIVACDPSVFILDEPTAGQDLYGMRLLGQIIDELHSEGKTVITITHDIEFAASEFERIIVMCQKEVIKDGTALEVFYDDEAIERAKLKAPYVVRLARTLGIGNGTVLTEEDFVKAYV